VSIPSPGSLSAVADHQQHHYERCPGYHRVECHAQGYLRLACSQHSRSIIPAVVDHLSLPHFVGHVFFTVVEHSDVYEYFDPQNAQPPVAPLELAVGLAQVADDMDMNFCCRGPRKKMYEDLDMEFCCRSEDVYEDEDDNLLSLEDPVEDLIDTSAADSAAARLASSTAHSIIAQPVERHRIVPDLESALPQGKSIEAPVVVASSKATLSDKPSRSSSPLSHEGALEPAATLSSITLTPPSSREVTKNTDLATARTMRCMVDTCGAFSKKCAHFASAQPVIHDSKRSKRKVFVAWLSRLVIRAA
jgi:hypothetical protein